MKKIIVVILTELACLTVSAQKYVPKVTVNNDSVGTTTITFPTNNKGEYTQDEFLRINKLRLTYWVDKTPYPFIVTWPINIAVRFERVDDNIIMLRPLAKGCKIVVSRE